MKTIVLSLLLTVFALLSACSPPVVDSSLAAASPVVKTFKHLDWEWGGEWTQGKVDDMLFQKDLSRDKD